MPTDTAAEVKMCSACGLQPRASQESTNPHCRGCRAIYARIYRQGNGERSAARESIRFREGAEAFRRDVISQLARNPGASYRGTAVVEWLAGFPIPKFSEAAD